ncbi:hypothetical protein [Methylibium sp.]|uniref:hypothetical protein n=1 Tax=Methylibium sp. TaxID=2067992 RepID=UPI00286C4350|nr:hypothetical protein [Methylibium sp.]
MARMVGPGQKPPSESFPPPAREAESGAEAPGDPGWFDSSWELRQGLDVAELDEVPAEWPSVSTSSPSSAPKA